MPSYRVRRYLGPTYNDAGHHVGQWSEEKFATLEEAQKAQKMRGGALYRPRIYGRPRKRKRSRRRPRADELRELTRPPHPQDGASDQAGIVEGGSHI